MMKLHLPHAYRIFLVLLLSLSHGTANTLSDSFLDKPTYDAQAPLDYRDNTLDDSPMGRKTSPYLINAAFGLGKNFHAFRVGVAYSPMDMPQGWEKWDFYVEPSCSFIIA